MKAEKIVTTRLDEKIFNKLSQIAEKEKVSKSTILRKALDAYLTQGESRAGGLIEISQKLNELEKKYYDVINRLNILSRQFENLQKKRI